MKKAKSKKIKGYSQMTKAELQKALAPPPHAQHEEQSSSSNPEQSSGEQSSGEQCSSSDSGEQCSSSNPEQSSGSSGSSDESGQHNSLSLSKRIHKLNIIDMKKACKESDIKISKYDAKKKKSKPKSRAGLQAELEAYCLGQSVAPTTSQASFSSSPCEAGEREVRGGELPLHLVQSTRSRGEEVQNPPPSEAAKQEEEVIDNLENHS